MKIIEFHRFGAPADVLRCVSRDDPSPGPGEASIRMLRMPINPADLLLVEGRYGARPPKLPATPGAEGVGVVAAVGEGVSSLAVGDYVAPLISGLWRSIAVCRADLALRLPPDIELEQAAMLKANPATAAALLDEAAAAAPGEAIIQNAANSSVGRLINSFGSHRGVKVINVVRRAGAAEEILRDDPEAIVVVDDGADARALQSAVSKILPDISIGFAIDAIGGFATNALAACLKPGGVVANYGLLSGETCRIDPAHLVFRSIVLRGFWLPTWFRAASVEKTGTLYQGLIEALRAKRIQTPVRAVYPLEEIGRAVAHAAQEARGGKILLSAD